MVFPSEPGYTINAKAKEFPMLETIFSILGLIALLVIVWIVARFLLKIGGCVLYAVLTAILAIGILAILFIFVF
jgi:hypothetical protein